MLPLSTKKAGISGKAEYPQKARVRHPLEEMPGLNYAHRWRCLYSPEGYYIRGYRPGKICKETTVKQSLTAEKRKPSTERRAGRA